MQLCKDVGLRQQGMQLEISLLQDSHWHVTAILEDFRMHNQTGILPLLCARGNGDGRMLALTRCAHAGGL